MTRFLQWSKFQAVLQIRLRNGKWMVIQTKMTAYQILWFHSHPNCHVVVRACFKLIAPRGFGVHFTHLCADSSIEPIELTNGTRDRDKEQCDMLFLVHLPLQLISSTILQRV